MASSPTFTSAIEKQSLSREADDEQHLPAVLKMRDLTVLFVLAVVFISNVNGVQFAGPAVFTYWLLSLLTFLLPTAYVTQWLAKRFPGQGGIYLWAVQILGPQWGFISAFCIWLSGTIGVVSAIEGCTVFIQYLAPSWFTNPIQLCLGIISILLLAAAITCLPLRFLVRILLILTALYFSVCSLQGIAGVIWLLRHQQAAVSLTLSSQWLPDASNFAVYGLIVLALLGVNTPLVLGGEIRGGKAGMLRARHYVWWGAGLSFFAYIAGTFGVMTVVAPAQAGTPFANIQVIQIVFGSLAGNIAAIFVTLGYFGIAMTYLLIFSRILTIVAKDSHLPMALTKLNRCGVPIRSIVIQTMVIGAVALLSYIVVPGFFTSFIKPADLSFEIYNVLQAVATTVLLVSSVQLFVLPLRFLHHVKTQEHIARNTCIILWVVACTGIGASAIGLWSTISSSWIPSLIPNDHWAVIVLGITFLFLAIGWLSSELPRAQARLNEQRRVNDREVALRAQLQVVHEQMQETHQEQEILIQQQQELLAEVDRLYREQTQAAITDAITGLPNHRAVMSRVDEELARCERAQASCAILFIDLDHFKRVNDTWGHRAGDAILREVASRLRSTLRLEDFVGRYGGEEFAIVLVDADIAGASEIAERLRLAVADEPCVWMVEDGSTSVSIPITTSIGVAVYGIHGSTREKLVEHADQAMYRSKQGGRNRVSIADLSEDEAPKSAFIETNTETPQVETTALQVLTAAASARDRGTNDHSHRMVALAEATARSLNRPEEEVHLVHLGALLHDIGKIGIPDAILHKPGPLSDEEWEVMRRHPEIGQKILSQAGGIFSALASIVVAHHERWDGHGYPRGLEQEAIPLAARILTVIDSYDAMTSRRVYRAAMSPLAARQELQRCSGSQYDPDVVSAFLHVLDTHDIMGSVLVPVAA